MLPSEVDIGDEPLEYRTSAVSFPQISDQMVASIALGMEDELVVAARHDMTVEQYVALRAQPWFQMQVATKRSEFEKNGVTFRAKAAWMASDILDEVYLMAAGPNASLSQKHDVLKTLIKAGGLEPKEEKKVQQIGTSYVFNINRGAAPVVFTGGRQPKQAIDVDAKEIE